MGQRVAEDIPEILFIGNVQNNGTLEGWKMMPMKVALGVFVKDSSMVPIQKTQIGQTGLAKNRFKVLEVDDVEEETISRYLRWTMLRRRGEEVVENSVACGLEGSKAQERVQFVFSVNKDEEWLSLGVGDIILDSAADESCWPVVGEGKCFPDEGKTEEDVAEDCDWRRRAALRIERGVFQVQWK